METLKKLYNAKEACFAAWAHALALHNACPSEGNYTLVKRTSNLLCEASNAYFDTLQAADPATVLEFMRWKADLDGMATD